MDAQERKLREETAGSGVDVIRDGDNLVLRMPSGITFATDSSAVQPQFQPTLNDVASVLAQYPKTYIDVYGHTDRSEEHTSELQSLMRISYAVFCLKKKNTAKHN